MYQAQAYNSGDLNMLNTTTLQAFFILKQAQSSLSKSENLRRGSSVLQLPVNHHAVNLMCG